MRDLLRSAWTEPAPPDPPGRGWRDWTIAALAVALAVLEGVMRPDLPHRFVTVALTIALVPTLLWRRTHPLAMVAVSFVIAAVASLAGLPDLYITAFVLLLPYALFRWGSGRAVIIGLALMVVDLAVVAATGESSTTDAIGGGVAADDTCLVGETGASGRLHAPFG